MKELINRWFEQSAPFQGILACGVRHPDQSAITKTWTDGFSEMALENALRCMADLFHVLQLNRIPPARVRWVYAGALFHCERRTDGSSLGVFTVKDSNSLELGGLDRFFSEFQALTSTTAP